MSHSPSKLFSVATLAGEIDADTFEQMRRRLDTPRLRGD